MKVEDIKIFHPKHVANLQLHLRQNKINRIKYRNLLRYFIGHD